MTVAVSESLDDAARRERFEQTRQALEQCNGNRTHAAKCLRISRWAMHKRMAAFPDLAARFPSGPGRPSEPGSRRGRRRAEKENRG